MKSGKTHGNQGLLRRYTDTPSLIYLLSERKITLLDPQSWDDHNDAHYITLYRRRKNLESVLALCFTQASERYHHWRVFANGSTGVCIHFRRSELLKAVGARQGLRGDAVVYRKLNEIRKKPIATEDLPFLKRYPFQDEDEFRLIYESKDEELSKLDIPVPLSCIDRVTLSPWLHHDLLSAVRQLLQKIEGCAKLRITRSTLINNEEWKRLGESGRKQTRPGFGPTPASVS
ncbi:MAG: DUF2971 domain-containing protein [Bryobacteraceae bacterium]